MKIIIFFLSVLLIVISCGTSKKEDVVVIATVDNRPITLVEFRDFYNFDVNFAVDSTGLGTLRDELIFLIAQIRAWEKCQKNGLSKDEVFIKASEWEKRQAMLRELYRTKILDKIEVSDSELRDLFITEQKQFHLRHLFYKNIDDALNAQKKINNGSTSFEMLAKQVFNDTTLANRGGDLGWIPLSELEREFGESVRDLTPGNISRPIKSKWGYHVVDVLDVKENKIISESDYQIKKPSLEKKIRAQKSQEFSNEYIKNFIGNLNPQLDKNLFKKVWDCLIPEQDKEKAKLTHESTITPFEINKLKTELSTDLNKPFVHHNDGFITLSEFLAGIEKIPVGHLFRFNTQRKLSNDIGKWVRDEILFKEAEDLNLSTNQRVLNEVSRFMEEQSFYYFHGYVMDTLSIPQSIEEFYKNSKKETNRENKYKRFHTLQEWQFEKSKEIIIDELTKDRQNIWINNDVLNKENESIDWNRRIRMFMVRKPS